MFPDFCVCMKNLLEDLISVGYQISILFSSDDNLEVLDYLFSFRVYFCIPHAISRTRSCEDAVNGPKYIF